MRKKDRMDERAAKLARAVGLAQEALEARERTARELYEATQRLICVIIRTSQITGGLEGLVRNGKAIDKAERAIAAAREAWGWED